MILHPRYIVTVRISAINRTMNRSHIIVLIWYTTTADTEHREMIFGGAEELIKDA